MVRARGIPLVALIALIIGAGWIFVRYQHDLDDARDAATRGSMIAATASGPIEYAEKGAGAPLLSIHGAGGGFDQGLSNAAVLAGGDFRVISPSRFGYLRTPVPADSSPAAQADAHVALLAKLNVPSTIVIGISAGARSAIELAIRHPRRTTALILISPATYAPTSPVAIDASGGSQLAFWLVNAGADFAWWAVEKTAPSILIRFMGVRTELVAASSKAVQNRVMGVVRAVEPLSLRMAGISIDSNTDLRRLPLERIAAPTLVISARDDLFNTLPAATFAAKAIPGARLVVFDNGGHLLVGREQEARDLIRAFLTQAGLVPLANAQ